MSRSALLVLSLFVVACKGEGGIVAIEDTDAEELPTFEAYDDATLRIVKPASGAFLAIEEAQAFEAELLDAAGAPLPFDDVTWTSSLEAGWAPVALAFDDQPLDVGVHDILAQAELPNGDRLAYAIGGVRVQSWYAGTYAGLFAADVITNGVTVVCGGAATLFVDMRGEKATGTAECTIGFNGIDLPATFLFDLDNDGGALTGVANIDLGFFEVPLDATGSLDRTTGTAEIAFGGDVYGFAEIDGTVDADRVSLDVP